jgi:hypothetical protein
VYAGLVVGLGFIVARGYERTFDRTPDTSPTAIAPLAVLRF